MYTSPDIGHMISGIISHSQKNVFWFSSQQNIYDFRMPIDFLKMQLKMRTLVPDCGLFHTELKYPMFQSMGLPLLILVQMLWPM